MGAGAYDEASAGRARDADAPRERSIGEHVFIWLAWALAAAFWGATLSTVVGIFRAAGQAVQTARAPGLPGGMTYLALVVIAFLAVAFTLLYEELRNARASRRLEAVSEAGTAALYNRVERQGEADLTARSPDRDRPERNLR